MNARLLIAASLFCLPLPCSALSIVGGDSIGSDSTLTDHLGGFAAVQDGVNNYGQPAMVFSQDGTSLLRQLRVIVHGSGTSGDEEVRFDQFRYVLLLWRQSDYLAGAPPGIEALLGDPLGVVLEDDAASVTAPREIFGNAAFHDDEVVPSYDFLFDLAEAKHRDDGTDVFAAPLVAGEWVVAFQSEHPLSAGTLLVSFSSSLEGNVPYFHKAFNGAEQHPRGVLLDQQEVTFRWGMDLLQRSLYADYDDSDAVEGNDFLAWQRGDSPNPYSTGDLELWESHLGAEVENLALPNSVPEPSLLWQFGLLAGLARRRRRGNCP